MEVSSDTYLVISLMFAVFAAVAAVGTSIVLGVGYERLRAGFDVIKKQTGFFADAIHKLDERTKVMNAQTGDLKTFVNDLSQKVDRVDAQSAFFVDSLQSLENKIEDLPKTLSSIEPAAQSNDETLLPREMDYLMNEDFDDVQSDVFSELSFVQEEAPEMETPQMKQVDIRVMKPVPANEDTAQPGLSKLLASYFRGGSTQPQDRVYH